MAEVYQISENILSCFTRGVSYMGFTNGAESCIDKEPIKVIGEVIKPGDMITGFDSGKKRTSFILNYGYMTYVGKRDVSLLFEVYDSKSRAKQGDLFSERPKWYLDFSMIGEWDGFLMFSQPGAAFDIRPKKILRYKK